MSSVTSQDGTRIVYDQQGQGPAVVLVGGVLGERSQQAPVASLLADSFTVFNYDRRAHGESGDTVPYAAEREIEDLAAIIEAAGGSACVYGTSGCAVLSLRAAAKGLPITKLAVWEPPFIVDDSRPPVPADYQAQLATMLAEGRRGDMVAYFMTQAVGMPAEVVSQMRQAPWWGFQEMAAHTLVYDAAMMGDYSLPAAQIASITIPTLVMDGGITPWLTSAASAVAATLPNIQRRTLVGQPHNVAPEAVAPVLKTFFAG